MTLTYLVPDCKSVSWLSAKKNIYNTLLSYDCKTGFATKILDPSSVAWIYSVAVNKLKGSTREPAL